MTLSPTDVVFSVNGLLHAAETDPSYKELPLEGKLVVLKSAAALVEQMVVQKAALDVVSQMMDKYQEFDDA